ncbi:MAG: ADP-ribosylglycohydrolase family protein [Leptolyngbya sp.]|nr:ADP-ribosylglycohydrolase family protein [Candidatus Melainabacteria bacterium]
MLLGTSVGDALGLYMEGLSSKTIHKWFASGIDRYYLLGEIGFVSDDTEQSALIAQSLIRHPNDSLACARAFRVAMVGWFSRMPFGVGRATCFACLKMALFLKDTGIRSAGNGAAMRAAIIGIFFYDDEARRREFGERLARTTHSDERAVDGALFVAEMAAHAYSGRNFAVGDGETARYRFFDSAVKVVNEPSLKALLLTARTLAETKAEADLVLERLGSSGFVNHSVPISTYTFLRFGSDTMSALQSVIYAGGDTDTNAAMVGAWCGALRGEKDLPQDLISQINNGPFGPKHLRKLARGLASIKGGNIVPPPVYFWPLAFSRNVALIPIILSHTFVRIVRSVGRR